jgi:hypothetical protein
MALCVVLVNNAQEQLARAGMVKRWHYHILTQKKGRLGGLILLAYICQRKLKCSPVIFAGGRASLRGLSCCEIPQFTSESRIETPPPLNPFRVNAINVSPESSL